MYLQNEKLPVLPRGCEKIYAFNSPKCDSTQPQIINLKNKLFI